MSATPPPSLPGSISLVERKDKALRGALEHLAPGPWMERADTPDGVITDVLGAQNQALACLFIAKGIHGEAAIGPDGRTTGGRDGTQ